MGAMLATPVASKGVLRLGTDHFRAASCEMHGWRNSMEDEHTMLCDLGPICKDHTGVSFYGVYDGHSGNFCSRFLKQLLVDRVMKLSPNEVFTPAAIEKTVISLDKEFLDRPLERDNGSTCAFALVRELKADEVVDVTFPAPVEAQREGQRWLVLCVGVGDSRITLIRRDGSFVVLTTDHKPALASEAQRIEAAGGTTQMGRVDGQLALSRALGDWSFKNNSGLPYHQQKVIAIPDIVTAILYKDDALLVACDGVTESCTDAVIVETVINEFQRQRNGEGADPVVGGLDPGRALVKVMDVSLASGSKDNHTAILVCFGIDGRSYGRPTEFLPGPARPFLDNASFKSAYWADAQRHGQNEETVLPLLDEVERNIPDFFYPANTPGGADAVDLLSRPDGQQLLMAMMASNPQLRAAITSKLQNAAEQEARQLEQEQLLQRSQQSGSNSLARRASNIGAAASTGQPPPGGKKKVPKKDACCVVC
jgi:serine/threonine protein phosphatase PrpC